MLVVVAVAVEVVVIVEVEVDKILLVRCAGRGGDVRLIDAGCAFRNSFLYQCGLAN
jgi:hypothetical protein